MKLRTAVGLIALLLLLVGGQLVPARAATRESALGSVGEVYLPRVGYQSEFFPESQSSAGDDPLIVALQVLRPGEQPQWLAVPESEVMRPDASCFVLYEDLSDTVFIVWEGRVGSHPMIKLASYRQGEWSDVLQVSDSAWTWKGFPRLAITRDSFELAGDGGAPRQIQRTLLHVVWWEDDTDGPRTLYRPLVLLDGVFQGLGPVYVLNDLVEASEDATAEIPATSLTHHPSLQVIGDGKNLIVTFADEARRKLFVLDIGLLPAGLGLLGEDAFHFVTDYPQGPPQDSSLESFAGAVRARILISGGKYKLNPRSVQLLANDIQSQITGEIGQQSHQDLSSLAGLVRARILISGARLSSETIDRFTPLGSTSVLEVAPEWAVPSADPTLAGLPHVVRFSILRQLPTPATGEGNNYIFSSPDGQRLIVAWEEEEGLFYREAFQGQWSGNLSVPTGDHLTLAEALEAVRQRALKSF